MIGWADQTSGVTTVLKCSNCGRENKQGEVICVYCGSPLVDIIVKTKALENTDFEENMPKWGSARPSHRIRLYVLNDTGKEETLSYETKDIEQLVIGRVDPATNEAPVIDLSRFNALEKGVSRRHAAIIRKDAALHLVDLSAANGTFLNGQRLVPDQPRILRDGDDIRLGHLVIRIAFERT